MPRVNPEILVWARETAGLGAAEAARKLGYRDSDRASAAQKLAEFEEGVKEPSRSLLSKMAQQYRRPLLAFYLSQPPAKGDRGADFRTRAAARSATDAATLDALIRDVQARQSMVRAVLEAEDAAAALEFVGSLRMTEGASAALASLRTLLDVSVAQYRSERNASYAFNLLRNSAERAGIYVLLIGNLGNYRTNIATDSFRGFAIADRIAPFIVINDQDARPAWSFTLLHEAVHLLLGHTGVGNVRTDSAVERFCDDVAGEFLLPTDELNAVHWDSSDLNALSGQISDFADGKKVSRSMAAYQAYRAGRIDRETCSHLTAAYRQQWREERERQRARNREQEGSPNYYTIRRHRLGNRITDLARQMMATDALSTSKAARILGVKSRQVQPLLDSFGRSGGRRA